MLEIRTAYHSNGRPKAVRGTPRQPPGNYFGIYSTEWNTWFRWSYTSLEMAEYTMQNIVRSWEKPPLPNGDRKEVDRVDNFTKEFSFTLVTTSTRPVKKPKES